MAVSHPDVGQVGTCDVISHRSFNIVPLTKPVLFYLNESKNDTSRGYGVYIESISCWFGLILSNICAIATVAVGMKSLLVFQSCS